MARPVQLSMAVDSMPERVRSLVSKRVDTLPRGSREMLNCLSVCDRSIPLSVLATTCPLSTSTPEASLDEAIRRKIVRATPGGIAITGRLIREAVRSSLSVGERISTHRRLAFALMIDAVYGSPESAALLADQAFEIAANIGNAEMALRALNWKVIAFYQQARLNSSQG